MVGDLEGSNAAVRCHRHGGNRGNLQLLFSVFKDFILLPTTLT